MDLDTAIAALACMPYIELRDNWQRLYRSHPPKKLSRDLLELGVAWKLQERVLGGLSAATKRQLDELARTMATGSTRGIVEAFDAKGVSFVSVTQQFNTTTSMGRLTLNMLLSFAQFEREVTGERIRDKIAASKQKGMWMGGLPPLGYDVADRKLIVNASEADTVRHVFHRYIALSSVLALKEELDADGIVSKARRKRNGDSRGRLPIAVGALYHILQNRLYRGEIVHKGKACPGQHEAIIEAALWDDAQTILAGKRIERAIRSKAADPSLLAGLVFDACGENMSPTHANKKGTRYRYHVSLSLITRGRPQASEAACRVPAADLERIVEDRICMLQRDETAMLEVAGSTTVAKRKSTIENAAELARRWPALPASAKRAILQALIARIDVRADTVDIAIRPAALSDVVTPDLEIRRLPTRHEGPTSVLSMPARLRRTGMETKLLIQGALGAEPPRRSDRSLLRLIAMARHLSDLVMTSNGRSMQDLAVEAGVSPSYFTRVFRLSFLAPEITKTILQGRQPSELSAIKLMGAGQFAGAGSDQRRQLGFV